MSIKVQRKIIFNSKGQGKGSVGRLKGLKGYNHSFEVEAHKNIVKAKGYSASESCPTKGTMNELMECTNCFLLLLF